MLEAALDVVVGDTIVPAVGDQVRLCRGVRERRSDRLNQSKVSLRCGRMENGGVRVVMRLLLLCGAIVKSRCGRSRARIYIKVDLAPTIVCYTITLAPANFQ